MQVRHKIIEVLSIKQYLAYNTYLFILIQDRAIVTVEC